MLKVVFTAGTWEVQNGTETLLRTARKVDAIEFAHRTATASGTGVALYKKNGEVQLSVTVCRGHNPGWKPRPERPPKSKKDA